MNPIEMHVENKCGGVLLMAMLVMLAFSILAIGLFQMSATNSVETVYQDHLSQAFWQAETGLQDAIQRLATDEDFRKSVAGSSSTFSVTNASSRTGYDVTVADTFGGSAIIAYYEFDVLSTGWKGGMSRTIKQYIDTQPGFISAIMSPGNINVAANTLVSGPIMVLDDGTLILDDKIPPGQDSEEDHDIIILDDGASINQKKSNAKEGSDYSIVDLSVPDDLPEMPDYSYLEANANDPSYNPVVSSVATNLGAVDIDNSMANYKDGIIYYDSPSITISKITGSGSIVNTGDIIIDGSTVTDGDVSSDVSVFSFGSVSIDQKTDFDGNTLIYASESVEFGDGSYMEGNSAILADGGDVIMGGQSEFYGIVFADDGDVIVEAGSGGDNNTRITGTVISGGDVDMRSNTEIIFDPSVFYGGDFLDLTKFFETEVITTVKTWEVDPK